MKIIKYTQFIKEELQDTPESHISVALGFLKKKIDKMFDYQETIDKNDEDRPEKIKKIKKSEKMTFEDLGVRLESSEISKYSKLYDSLTVKFSDDNSTYALIIMIDIKEGLPKDAEKDFEMTDIEKCYIKFKKYDLDTFEVIGQISKNVEFNKIDEDFLIDLKIELDDKFGDEEEFEIETE
jgi:hypothetical protein